MNGNFWLEFLIIAIALAFTSQHETVGKEKC